MAFDEWRYNVSMHSLCDAIQKRESLSGNNKVYIEGVKELLGNVTKALDSILNPQTDGGYFFMEPSLKKVIEVYGKDISKMPVNEITQIRQDFGEALHNLENLENDSSDFYESGNGKFTFNFLKKLLPRNGGFSEYSQRGTNPDLEGDD
jgi:hypothetical protein